MLEAMEHWTYTVADYVLLEEHTDLKHEFYRGDVRAMGGGTNEHARLGARLIAQLGRQLEGGPCEIYSSDLRIRVGADLITYPDASVVCGEIVMDTEDPNAQLNPTVICEVTSPSSESYDRGGKLTRYQQIPSLREYVVVSHRERAVDVFRRMEDGSWGECERFGPGEHARLHSIACAIDVDALYRRPGLA
jgi:Uma2 family endonuclease